MALQDLEKLNTSIVALPSGDFELKLDIRNLAEIVKEPQIETLPPPANLARITSLRDQVEITIGQGRIQIRDHSDDKPGTDKFTRIVSGFTNLLGGTSGIGYRAFGWNYDVSFSLGLDQLPAEAIATRFIDREAIKRTAGLEVVGGGVRFFTKKKGHSASSIWSQEKISWMPRSSLLI